MAENKDVKLSNITDFSSNFQLKQMKMQRECGWKIKNKTQKQILIMSASSCFNKFKLAWIRA